MNNPTYGLKISQPPFEATTSNPRNLSYGSTHSTYTIVTIYTVVVTTNPHVITHGLGYIPKVFVYEVQTNFNRRLPYVTATVTYDFSVNAQEVKIRGATSGTFQIVVFSQSIL